MARAVVDLQPGFVDARRDAGVMPPGESHQPARCLAEDCRLVFAGKLAPRLLQKRCRLRQQPAAVEMMLQLLLDGGQFHLDALGGMILGSRLHLRRGGLPQAANAVDGLARLQRGHAGLRQSLFQCHQPRFAEPPFQLGQAVDAAPGFEPGLLRALRLQTGLLHQRPSVDQRQKFLLCFDIPAGNDFPHPLVGQLHSPQRQCAAQPMAGRFPVQPLAQLLQVFLWRAIGQHVAFHHQLLDAVPEGGQLFSAQPRFLGGALAFLIQSQQGVAVAGKLFDVGWSERGGQRPLLQRLLPAAPGCHAPCGGAGKFLFGSRHAISQHMERTLAGGDCLQSLHLRLRGGRPTIERRGMFARITLHRTAPCLDLLVDQPTLGNRFIPLLAHHQQLLARPLQPTRGGPIERPGCHRGNPGASQTEGCHRIGE